MSVGDWQQLQGEDENLARVKEILTCERDSDTIDKWLKQPEVVLLLKERSKLLFVDDMLYRKTFNQRGEAFLQIVMPWN